MQAKPTMGKEIGEGVGGVNAYIIQTVPSSCGQVSGQFHDPLLQHRTDKQRGPPEELPVYGLAVGVLGESEDRIRQAQRSLFLRFCKTWRERERRAEGE